MTAVARAIQLATAPAAARFSAALSRPEAAQVSALRSVLRAVTGSRQAARIPGFAKIRTVRDLQDAVPIATADSVAEDVESLKRGGSGILTGEPVLRFEKSGGSSGASKYVPHTRSLLREMNAALGPWIYDISRSRPATRRGPGYWSVSPLGAKRELTQGLVPVGSTDDVTYFPRALQGLLGRQFAVPGAVGLLPDVESCRYVTLRLLLARPDLAVMSAWNPSFLTLLIDALERDGERLADDVAYAGCRVPPIDGMSADAAHERAAAIAEVLPQLPLPPDPRRARVVREALAGPAPEIARTLWPDLALLSVWTDADAARFLPALRARFPGVEIQGKGLLATEGVVTVPMFDAAAPVLAVRSHVYEFLDPRKPDARPLLAHELENGAIYEVLFSTGGGFLRYRVGDLVRVDGKYRETPCLRFVGRADAVTDLVGEKVSAARVASLLERILGSTPRFSMVAPEMGEGAPPAYRLFFEGELTDDALASAARAMEAALAEGHPYEYARRLGQLGELKAVRVRGGVRAYEARCIALGQRAGDVKPVALHRVPGWTAWFAAHGREGEAA